MESLTPYRSCTTNNVKREGDKPSPDLVFGFSSKHHYTIFDMISKVCQKLLHYDLNRWFSHIFPTASIVVYILVSKGTHIEIFSITKCLQIMSPASRWNLGRIETVAINT